MPPTGAPLFRTKSIEVNKGYQQLSNTMLAFAVASMLVCGVGTWATARAKERSFMLERPHVGEIRVDYRLANNSEEEWRLDEYRYVFLLLNLSLVERRRIIKFPSPGPLSAVQPSVVGIGR
jgi:hypothetical protein